MIPGAAYKAPIGEQESSPQTRFSVGTLFLMQIVLCLDVVVGLHVDPVPLRQPEGP
jgi:hypothetical protein